MPKHKKESLFSKRRNPYNGALLVLCFDCKKPVGESLVTIRGDADDIVTFNRYGGREGNRAYCEKHWPPKVAA